MSPSALGEGRRDAEIGVRLHHRFDRAYRELVEELPLRDLLRALCAGLAEDLDLPLATLVRRHESGALELKAASREISTWAELTRMPERWDGTVAGQGPAARAVHGGVPVRMQVTEAGFLPWREAAKFDGISEASAWPLDTADARWVLVLYRRKSSLETLDPGRDEAGEVAAAGCGRLIDACMRLERQRGGKAIV
ncbi:MAG: hypothetical protein ACT4PZ_19090 [Panacagrimonas sp.]